MIPELIEGMHGLVMSWSGFAICDSCRAARGIISALNAHVHLHTWRPDASTDPNNRDRIKHALCTMPGQIFEIK